MNQIIFNLDEPIIPFVGFGDIPLYISLDEFEVRFRQSIEQLSLVKEIRDNDVFFSCDSLVLRFIRANGKLASLSAKGRYAGKLHGSISIGDSIDKVLTIYPNLEYDDFEEAYFSWSDGVTIETLDDLVWSIEIYVKEFALSIHTSMDESPFLKGLW